MADFYLNVSYLFLFNLYNLPTFLKTHFNKKTVRFHPILITIKISFQFILHQHINFLLLKTPTLNFYEIILETYS